MMADFLLTGRKALVTGAGRGIGRGIALALAEAGADVAITSRTEANARPVAGCVINISGTSALRASAHMAAYAAAKAGLTRFTESLALGWAPSGVCVNAIAPGIFPDPEQFSDDDLRRQWQQVGSQIPLGRVGQLREVGLLAVYLCSDAAAYVTGATIPIDG